MVQINLSKKNYDEAIRQKKAIPEWINRIADNDLKQNNQTQEQNVTM